MPERYWSHDTAIIDDGALIGDGTRIWHWTHISASAVIGSNCNLGQNVFVGRARIGNNVKVQNNVSIYDEVEVEDDVFCGPSMVFTNVINPRAHVSRKHEYRKTLVQRGATLGANCTILCGNIIGRYAMIGAGAVVTRNVADYALVVGTPARPIGWVCHCGVRLLAETCSVCNRRYAITADECQEITE